MLTLLLLVPAGALAVSNWAEGLFVLSLIVMVAVWVSYLMAISRFSDGVILLLAVLYGTLVVWDAMSITMPYTFTFRERMLEIAFRTRAWFELALGGGFSRDNLMFVLLMAACFWFLTFNAVMNVFRAHHLWVATIPPGLALLINTYYYGGGSRMDVFLMVYLFLMLMLALRTNIQLRERLWRSQRVGYTPGIYFDLLRGGFLVVLLLLFLAWSLPAASASNPLASAWDRSINPWNRVQDTFSRLFNGLQGRGAVSADYYGGATLSMGGPVNLGSQTVLYVYAPQGHHYYWRSKLFDTYSNGQWTASTDDRAQSDFGIILAEAETAYRLRTNVQQRFQIAIPSTRLVYAAPQPMAFSSLPVTYDVIYTSPNREYGTIVAVRGANPLKAGRKYEVTSSISIADEASLRAAGTEYPAWVGGRYLKLPDTVTPRTRELAATITAPYDNPYDKARAIESYLRSHITYNRQVSAPPATVEPVDYLLFERPEGYCNYYASAMVVMLRAAGIPSRVAAGFAQGTLDDTLKAYRVLESDAHSWVEAYFPGYGWIEFEPTSAILAITRPASYAGAAPASQPDSEEETLEPGDLAPQPTPNRFEEDIGPAGGSSTLPAPLSTALLVMGGLSVMAVVLLLAGVGAWFWLEQRGLMRLSEISRSYARLNAYAQLLKITADDSATPYERAAQIIKALPEGKEPIYSIVNLYVAEQYGPPSASLLRYRQSITAHEAWGAARRVVLRRMLKRLNIFGPQAR